MSATPQRYHLPDHLGYGWLDRHSVKLSDRLAVAYVNGEDLVYRVTAENDRHWGWRSSIGSKPSPALKGAPADLIARTVLDIASQSTATGRAQ